MKKILLVVFFLVLLCSYTRSSNIIESPGGNIEIVINAGEGSEYGPAGFVVVSGKDTVFPYVRLGLITDNNDYYSELIIVSSSKRVDCNQNYNMTTGKRFHCVNKGTQCLVQFSNRREIGRAHV